MSHGDESWREGAGSAELYQASLKGLRPEFYNDLVRLGNQHDGGYVVNETAVLRSDYLMSFGINDDWSFETDFLNRNQNSKALCFDPSVSKVIFGRGMLSALNDVLSMKFVCLIGSLNLSEARQKLATLKHKARVFRGFSRFLARPNVRFYSLGLSNREEGAFLTFARAMELMSPAVTRDNSVFVKMDIEQYEFRVLADLLKYSRFINSLVVEFHDLDILWDRFVELMKKLKADFDITHIHGNNYCSLIPNSDVPMVLEITFVKRGFIPDTHRTPAPAAYPIPQLDHPNDRGKRDYVLCF